MSIVSGTRLGGYEVLSLIGSGGMGEVYRARDTKLGREVAVKLLPPTFTTDPDRVARLKREAQLLASLNHQNIAAIYGLEDADSVHALVLELVEGPTLADRITNGPLAADEALPIARQIAEALEAAHQQGIVHRDLKPANIKVRNDGTVKVLDFGLAKLADSPAVSVPPNASASPTITTPAMTMAGVILGTAAYMSPEQAKGRPADKRSDIWAFGCVLYEMLTGRRPFEGDDVADTLAAVLRSEPDWSALPVDTAPPVRLMLSRCLEKDPRKRLSDISIARFLITEPALDNVHTRASGASRATPWLRWTIGLVAGIAIGGLVTGALWRPRSASMQPVVTRFTFELPAGQQFTNPGRHAVAVSPDGTRIAYVANQRLYLKAMWDVVPTVIYTPGIGGVTSPVFSPDGRWVAFWSAPGYLNKIAVSGGAPVRICELENPYGVSWDGGMLFIGGGEKGVLRVSDAGGVPEVVIRLNNNEVAHGPQLLPDGRSILFTLAQPNDPERWDHGQVVVQAIGKDDRKTIINGGADARYLRTGHIVYALGGALFGQRFDIRRMETRGGPAPVVEGVQRAVAGQTGAIHLSVSNNGSLVYVPGPTDFTQTGTSDVALLDRKGNVERLKLPSQRYDSPRFSPNGKQLAIGVDDGRSANIWIYDLNSDRQIRQLTIGGRNRYPIWTRDGARITFQSDRGGDQAIYWQRADGYGTAERLTMAPSGEAHIPDTWAPDGDSLLFSARGGASLFVLRRFTLHDKSVTPFDAVRSTAEPHAGFSRDGRWVAYAILEPANTTGSVYVRPFPPTEVQFRIGQGVSPFWAPDGKSLYFVTVPGAPAFSVVNIATEPSFGVSEAAAVPRPTLFGGGPYTPAVYDVAPDNQRFVVIVPSVQDRNIRTVPQLQFVINWFEELNARVPAQ